MLKSFLLFKLLIDLFGTVICNAHEMMPTQSFLAFHCNTPQKYRTNYFIWMKNDKTKTHMLNKYRYKYCWYLRNYQMNWPKQLIKCGFCHNFNCRSFWIRNKNTATVTKIEVFFFSSLSWKKKQPISTCQIESKK